MTVITVATDLGSFLPKPISEIWKIYVVIESIIRFFNEFQTPWLYLPKEFSKEFLHGRHCLKVCLQYNFEYPQNIDVGENYGHLT